MGWGVWDYPEPPDWWWEEHGGFSCDDDVEEINDYETEEGA